MNDALLLPRLRHWRWEGWARVAGRDLFEGAGGGGLPRVALGEDKVEGFEFVTSPTRRPWAELEKVALANLRKRSVEWSVTQARDSKRPALLTVIDELACERLLDSHFLQLAHHLLEDETLAVAMPMRGLLYATPAITGPSALATFLTLAERSFIDTPANREPLSPAAFTVQEARLTGVLGPHHRGETLTPARGFPWRPGQAMTRGSA